MSWEERMAARKRVREETDLERLYRLNEAEWPREKAEARMADECSDCVEIRQEFGRWMLFQICGVHCPHKHHENDGPAFA